MNHFEISGQKPEKSCKIDVSYALGVLICIALSIHCVKSSNKTKYSWNLELSPTSCTCRPGCLAHAQTTCEGRYCTHISIELSPYQHLCCIVSLIASFCSIKSPIFAVFIHISPSFFTEIHIRFLVLRIPSSHVQRFCR